MTKKTKDILMTIAAITLPLGAVWGGAYFLHRQAMKKEGELIGKMANENNEPIIANKREKEKK